MNEVRAIVEACDAANERGERCALATVVSVEGSSYRNPGARMLVRETGASTGTISAGCLEADVTEHAKGVIRTGSAKLVEYNTDSTSDEMAWGLGLGCSGIVRVLVEPLSHDSLYVEALRRSLEARSDDAAVSVATVYQCSPSGESPGASGIAAGARLIINEQGEAVREGLSGPIASMLERELRAQMRRGTTGNCECEMDGVAAKVFVETLRPPVRLVIFGAGQDALPIVELARSLGWQTEVVDPQARPVTVSRFAAADRVTLSRPEDVAGHISITPRTMTLLMSHNYSHDAALLRFLLASPACYIGVMGPRRRTERMLAELAASGETSLTRETNLARVHSPVGLDIGADGPAEIAVSIVAEMRAVLAGRHGGKLRDRRGSIKGSPNDGNRVRAAGHFREAESRSDRIGAVILAAGSSSRMGMPKQVLKFGGDSLLRRAALAALGAGCSPVIVVTGANAELSRRELHGLDVREVWNSKWETGMASSINAGLAELVAADASAGVFMVCDQPYATADVIRRLIEAHRSTRRPVVASTYSGSFGVPALFARELFAELARLQGRAGAKKVIKRHAPSAQFLPFPNGYVDVDTPEDLSLLIANDLAPDRPNPTLARSI